MAFAAWAEEIPSKIYQIPPGALAGWPQISPELAGRTPITHRFFEVFADSIAEQFLNQLLSFKTY